MVLIGKIERIHFKNASNTLMEKTGKYPFVVYYYYAADQTRRPDGSRVDWERSGGQ